MSIELLMEELRDVRDSLDQFRLAGSNLSTLKQFGLKCDESTPSTSVTPDTMLMINGLALSPLSWALVVLWLSTYLGVSFRLFCVLEALGVPKTTVSTFSIVNSS